MLTVLVQEVVLDVLAEELLYGVKDLLLLLQDVLVVLRVVSLGDGWEQTDAPLIVSKAAGRVQLKHHLITDIQLYQTNSNVGRILQLQIHFISILVKSIFFQTVADRGAKQQKYQSKVKTSASTVAGT